MIHSMQTHGLPSIREQEYLTGWQRAAAELDNFKKRLAGEQGKQRDRAREDVIASLLNLADNFQSIVTHMPESLVENNWAQGVTHVAKQFERLLKDHGVSVIKASDGEFNPALHEAVETVKDKKLKSGVVVEVIRPGYKLGENVLRPAQVKVAA